MSWQVIIELPAQMDIDEAFVWYEEQSVGLGYRFINSVNNTIEKIIRNPDFAFVLFNNIRSASLSVFPYEILYLTDADKKIVFVLAVGHLHRQPGWFVKRLK